MVREGLISPTSKAVTALSRAASPTPSDYSLVSSSTVFTSVERERRKLRHRNNRVLREGVGLTTGLGWSDSEDENEGGMRLMKRLSKVSSTSSLRSRGYSNSIRSAPPSSTRIVPTQHQHTSSTLSRSTTSTCSSNSNGSKTTYSAFSVQKPQSTIQRGKRSDSNASTGSNGSVSPLSPSSDSGSHRSASSRKLAQPFQTRTRLTSIGETSKTTEFGQLSKDSSIDAYGRCGFNYSAPRTSTRNSMTTTPSSSLNGLTAVPQITSRSLMEIGAAKPPPTRPPPPIPTTTVSTTNHRPRFRHGMDERVRRLEEKLKSDLGQLAPPADSDTERERSRTPTPNSPGASLSTDSLSSLAMPLTPRNERSLSDLSHDGHDRPQKPNETNLNSLASAEISEEPRMVTPTARRLQLPSSTSSLVSTTSTIRPILSSSNSGSQLPEQSSLSSRKRAGSASSVPRGLAAPVSILSKPIPALTFSASFIGVPRSTKSNPSSPTSLHTPAPPPLRPAPSSAYVTPSSVEYAQNRVLHPLSSAKMTRPPSTNILPPGLGAYRPRAATLHPLSPASYHLSSSTSNTMGSIKSSLVSKLAPRKGFQVTQSGIGAGGVNRL
jgi:hypothetical protein